MWFNNALIYAINWDSDATWEEELQADILKPCPAHARFIYGWLPAFDSALIHEVAGASLLCLGKEERVLPQSVIKKMLTEKVQALEATQGRTIKRAERAQMAEDLEFELLPKSFCIQKKLPAIIDKHSKQLIVNTSNSNQAEQLLSMLRKSLPGFAIEPFPHRDNLAKQFTQWMQTPTLLPADFQWASDCLLFALDNEKKRIHCKGYEMPAPEITTFIAEGMAVGEISLIWQERIQFTLTQDFVLKRIKCLDYLVDAWQEINQMDELHAQQDASLTLVAGELRQLVKALVQVLGTSTRPVDSQMVTS